SEPGIAPLAHEEDEYTCVLPGNAPAQRQDDRRHPRDLPAPAQRKVGFEGTPITHAGTCSTSGRTGGCSCCMACHKSYFACICSQARAVATPARSSRIAKSGLMPAFPLSTRDNATRDIPNRR